MKLLDSLSRCDACCNDRKANQQIETTSFDNPLPQPRYPPLGLDLVNIDSGSPVSNSEPLSGKIASLPPDGPASELGTPNIGSQMPPLKRTSHRTTSSTTKSSGLLKYDLFLSHLQRNGQDAIISMQVFLQQARPGIRIFIDLDVDMKGDLTGTLEEGVKSCEAFLFFITDGILKSEWCARELRWAAQYDKKVVLVRETDERHGGLDMNEFLKQVPDDLMHVFKNNIAIPWYRQPAFRNVSIQSILKAADLHDELAAHLERLERERMEVYSNLGNEDSVTCFDIITAHSWALRAVFFMGGFSRFRNKRLDRLYTIVFTWSFWACGALCAANLVYRCVPYHVIATDLLTAYVHLPAWQSWFTWRRFVSSFVCDELLVKVRACEGNKEWISLGCRVMGWVVIVVQLVMITVVLLGWTLPRTIGLGGKPGKDWGHDHEGAVLFTNLHTFAMWVAIPPVIAAMFASYSMFAFIAGLHWLDIQSVKRTLQECVSILGSYYSSGTGSSEAPGGGSDKVNPLGDREELFQTACDILSTVFRQTQNRIDNSCKNIGGLWVHLVLFATCQVLAISQAFVMHATEEVTYAYQWWWGLQDFFHLAGGMVFLTVAMGVFCIVTTSFHFVLSDTLELLGNSGCPAPRQASVISLLASRPLGMNILRRSIYIDASKASIIFFVVTSILLNNCIRVFNGMDL